MPLSPRTLRPANTFTPRSISGLALWLDASQSGDLYTTDAGPVVAVAAPTDISGCVGWWDASDASTLFAADTGSTLATTTVGRWANKGTLGSSADLLQATSGSRPTTGANTRNGRNVLTFTGASSNWMQRSFTLAQPCTAFVVFSFSSAYSATTTLIDGAGTGNTLRFAPTSNTDAIFVTGGNTPQFNLSGWGAMNTWQQASFVANGSASASLARRNGLGALNGSGATATATNPNGITIASWGGSALQFADAQYAEVIVFNSALASSDIARVEAYLAAKWGISGVHRSAAQEIAAVSSPAEISGLSDWYDATDTATVTLSGTKISSWASRVAGGRTLTQATDSLRPVMTDNIQNGLRMVKFDGVDDYIRTATPEAFGDKTVFVVARPTDVSASQTVWAASKQNITTYGYYYTAGFRVSSAAVVVRPETAGASARRAAANSNEAIVTAVQFKTSELVASNFSSTAPYKNGTLFDTNDSVVLADYAIGSTMGANDSRPASGFLSNFYSGYVGEVLVYDSYLSAVDRARVEKYLANKWGIANVPDPTPPVGYWRDRSGNGRHATQGTAGSRPLVGSIASGRGLVFDSNDSLLSLASIADIVGSPASSPATTIAFIALNSSGVAGFTVGSDNAANGRLLVSNSFDAAGGSFFDVAGASASGRLSYTIPASSQTAASVYVMQRSGASMTVRRNGATIATKSDASQTFSATTARLSIGQAIGLTGFSGTCGSMLCYPAAISTVDRQRLERYLAAKYGITLAPQVSNADAQDWINRVYANGGTVSASTAAAVNTLCIDLENASLRDRFYRMGIFCGTGLNAALVPLYRGPSLGGTQYGNTTDTNAGGVFVAGDYVETGATGGLTGGGTRYLDTGFPVNALPSTTSGHAAVYCPNRSSRVSFAGMIGVNVLAASGFGISTDTSVYGIWGQLAFATNTTNGLLMASRTTDSSQTTYVNGASIATNTTPTTPTASALNVPVFANRSSASVVDNYDTRRYCGYSIGLGMTAAQVSAYYTAMQSFQSALLRSV